jgi:hypothetical protein
MTCGHQTPQANHPRKPIVLGPCSAYSDRNGLGTRLAGFHQALHVERDFATDVQREVTLRSGRHATEHPSPAATDTLGP